MARVAIIALLVSSCARHQIDLVNLACEQGTCLPGWECDSDTDTCVPLGSFGDRVVAGDSTGDPAGDPASGDPLTGDPLTGDPLTGDPLPGDPLPGDPLTGDPLPGDPLTGDPLPGDPLPGDPLPGDPLPGDPLTGDPLPGDPLPGDPLPGDPLPGDPLPGDPNLACIGWRTDFSSAPTGSDDNGDGSDDWVMRSGGGFPTGELSGGVWAPLGMTSGILDTNPNNNFSGPTQVDVRMRATSLSTGSFGAVFWINADSGGGQFAPLFVDVQLMADDSQRLRLFGKSDNSTDEQLVSVGGLGTALLNIGLTITPATNSVALSLNGTPLATRIYSTFGPPTNDRFASFLAWSSSAEFDEVSVETCP